MDEIRILYDYLDGNLESSREKQLFKLLSNNEELRYEFKDLLELNKAISSDTKAFTPATNSTLNIFKEVGMPGYVGLAGALGVSAGKFFTKYSGNILTAALSVVATVIVMLLFFDRGATQSIKDNSNFSSNQLSERKIQFSEIEETSSILSDSLQNQNNDTKGSIEKEKIKIVYKYIYPEDTKELKNDNSDFASNNYSKLERVKEFKNISNSHINDNNWESIKIKNSTYNYQISHTVKELDKILESYGISRGDNFLLEFRGSEDIFFNGGEAQPRNYQNLNNLAFTFGYRPTDNFMIGIDYRRENFYQIYQGVQDNVLYEYEQQPNFESFGLLTRFSPNLSNKTYINPFVQTTLAANDVGYIFRAGIGNSLYLTNNLDLLLLLEYNNFRFKALDNWYNSEKLGIQIGLGFKF